MIKKNVCKRIIKKIKKWLNKGNSMKTYNVDETLMKNWKGMRHKEDVRKFSKIFVLGFYAWHLVVGEWKGGG